MLPSEASPAALEMSLCGLHLGLHCVSKSDPAKFLAVGADHFDLAHSEDSVSHFLSQAWAAPADAWQVSELETR